MDDLEQLVHIAAKGDPNAFVELTRRFQHFAFGSALALLGDFQQAEDSVREAFLAAWSGLPSLSAAGTGSSNLLCSSRESDANRRDGYQGELGVPIPRRSYCRPSCSY
jgi:hypothetical protein